jgi:endonuclease VIII
MPEGDTIFRAAQTLNRALAGSRVTRFEPGFAQLANIDRDSPIAGRTIEKVEARAKHLLMTFSGGLLLRTHLRMNGSWHLYRPGEPWQRARSRARIVIETERFVAVGFDIPEAEFIAEEKLARHDRLRRLGPDLLSTDFDAYEVLRRMRAQPERTLAEALLNQQVIAGAGNVFKSEILFAARLHPHLRVSEVSDAQLRRVIAIAEKFLRWNVREASGAGIVTYTGFRRTTRRANPEERLWVYGRIGKPCRECGTPIMMVRDGPAARSTYFCPHCQPRASELGQPRSP